MTTRAVCFKFYILVFYFNVIFVFVNLRHYLYKSKRRLS